MRKLFALILAAMLAATLAVNAAACTPRLQIPQVEIPRLRVEFKLPQSFWDGYFGRN